MSKKIIALILAAAMLLVLTTACSGSDSVSEAEQAPASTGSNTETPGSAEPETESPEASLGAAESDDTGGGFKEVIKLPITEETTTFTLWTGMSPDITAVLESYEQISVVRELEARTNIHLDATLVSFMEENTQFGLMVASGEYEDIICGAQGRYTTGIDGLIADDICMDLSDKLEEYCPNYWNKMLNDPFTYRSTMSDSGSIVSFYALYTETLYTSTKSANHWIRGDWLSEQGLERPETYDELYNTLVNFRDNYGAVMVFSSAADEYLLGYGIGANFYLDDSGKVAYGALTDDYRDYLKMMNKWYFEGLIYKDYYEESASALRDTTIYITDGAGVFEYTSNNLTTLFGLYDGELGLVPMPEITKEKDDIITVGFEETRQNGATWTISTSCEDWETLLTFIDYMYTDECAELWAYGIEDEAYTVGADGEKTFTDLILNNAQYSQLIAFYMYTISGMSGFPGMYNYFISATGWTDVQWEAFDVWSAKYGDNVNQYPDAASLTAAESEEYGAKYSDISTYQEEMVAKFIIGEADIENDAQWDEFTATLISLGLPRCVEIKQVSYERYLAR